MWCTLYYSLLDIDLRGGRFPWSWSSGTTPEASVSSWIPSWMILRPVKQMPHTDWWGCVQFPLEKSWRQYFLIVWNLCCACYAVGCVCWRDRKQNYHWLHLDWTTCQYGLQAGHMTSDSESITVRFCSTASVFKVLRNPWTDSIYLFWPRMCLLGCWDDGVLLNQIAFWPLWQIIIEREIAFLCRKATSHAAYQGKIDEDKDIESMKRGEVSCFHVFVASDVFNVPREINPTTTVTPWIVFFVIIYLTSFQWWVGGGGST